MSNKLLIFDLDGTLADTLYTIKDAVNMCMEHYGFPQQSYAQVRANVGNGVRVLIEKSLPDSVPKDSKLFEEILEYFRSCYAKTHDNIDGCYDGLYDVVLRLKECGYKLAVLSNKPDPLVRSIIKKLFADGVFSFVAGQNEMPRKPDPTVPRMIADGLGIDYSDCYFIGDSEVDILTAKNSGFVSVAVSWGFRDREALLDADRVVDSPDVSVWICCTRLRTS